MSELSPPISSSGSFATLAGVPGDNAALAAALAEKLDKAGGTMTGALTLNLGALATAGITHQQTWNSAGATCRGFELAVIDTNSHAASTPFRVCTGAAGSTEVFAIGKDGSPTIRATSGHYMDVRNSGAGLGWAALFAGSLRSGVAFNTGSGFSPMLHAVVGSNECLFGAGGTFGNPNSTTPNFFALIESHTAGTATYGATDKDWSGAYTGAGHNCLFRGGRGSSQGTGGAGGSATLRGGNARGSGNNNGGNVVIEGGDPTGTGTRGRVSITNLPTSSAGLSTGMLWNDAGTLKVA